MRQTMKDIAASWNKEVLFMLVGLGLFAMAPVLKAQTCDSDKNHYHTGSDHCDSGGSGCTVVCG